MPSLPLRVSARASKALALALTMLMCGALFSGVASAEGLTYNLKDNLPSAHRYEGGTIIDLNDISAVKHLRDAPRGWVYDVKKGEHSGAVPQSVQAHFWTYIDKRLNGRKLRLDVSLSPAYKKQVMDVFINGKKIANHNFKDDDWQTVSFPVAESDTKEGFAHVKLHFRKRADIKGNIKGPAVISRVSLSKAKLEPFKSQRQQLVSTTGEQLVLPKGLGLDYFIETTEASALKLNVSSGQLNVWAHPNGERPTLLKRGAKGEVSVSLAAFKGAPIRLMLRAPQEEASFSGEVVDPAPFKGAQAATSEPTKPKYVVFWLIDTLRADKLPFYQQQNTNKRKKVKTPHLSELAKEAMVVEPFYVQGNESKASHASLFTGTYPTTHKVYTEAAKLPQSLTTLAELFKAEGYRTGGYVSNGYVSDRWDFDQGFQEFQNFIRESKANNAAAVVKSAKRFIKKRKGKPFYLYLGTSDPHVTYRRHKRFIDDYSVKGYKGNYTKYLAGDELGKLKQKKRAPSAKDRARIEALYENEIAFNDHHFGELVKALKAEGIYDETMIIISADHGDEFWEHGSCGHGHSLYQELVSVPLMIRWPSAFPAGRLEGGAEGVDLLPTMMELLGAKPNKQAKIQGASLFSQLKASEGYPQGRMASKGTEMYTIAIDDTKVIYRGRGAIESYDLGRDISESKDLSESNAVLTLTGLDPLLLYLARPKSWQKSTWGAPNALRSAFPKSFPKAWRSARK